MSALRAGSFFLISFLLNPFAFAQNSTLLELSKKTVPESHSYLESAGAEIIPFRDGRSFGVWWTSPQFDMAKDPVLVSLHGSRGWAARDFEVWHEKLKGRNYAILTLQWWYGKSEDFEGYAKPWDIYPWIQEVLRSRFVPQGQVMLQGFSRGSANVYSIAFLDRRQAFPYFALIIANAGELAENFPANRPLLDSLEEKPLTGTNWILYCSELDQERPEICAGMDKTKAILESAGAEIQHYFRDAEGSHGGFMEARNLDKALKTAEGIIAAGRREYVW